MRKDIMVDIETLGTGEDATIFQIAGMSFDITTGETFDQINLIGDISKYPHLNVDGDTLKWWLKTDKELLTDLLHKGSLTEDNLIEHFAIWLYNQSVTGDMKDVFMWGNGILFDNAKLQHKMNNAYAIEKYPIFFRNDRDLRTLVELATFKSGLTEKELKDSVANENEVKHDALDDIKFQIRLAHKCYAILNGEEEKIVFKPTTTENDVYDVHDLAKDIINTSVNTGTLIVRTDEYLRGTGITTALVTKARELNATLIVGSTTLFNMIQEQHGFDDMIVITHPNYQLIRDIKEAGFLVDDTVKLSVIKQLINDDYNFLGGYTNIYAQ